MTSNEPKPYEWYRENPKRCLHPKIRNLKDALVYSAENNEEVPMVYLREHRRLSKENETYISELSTLGEAKVGKGLIENSTITRSASASGSSGVLNDLAVIPCRDRVAYGVLEELYHEYLTKKGRHVKRVANDFGKESGVEWFDGWNTNPQEAIKEFNDICGEITNDRSSGKQHFVPRYYQQEAADSISTWFQFQDKKEFDFYLMLKPRAGKNATSVLALSQIAKISGEKQVVLMISMWPSAFSGMSEDCKQYLFSDCLVDCVNTQVDGWESKLEDCLADDDSRVVVVMSSMQSLDFSDKSGEFDVSKTRKLKAIGAKIVLFDESDHGLRTVNSLAICEEFKFSHRVWMSGSDLYAMRYLIESNNHYSYDIYQEIQDVNNGKIERRPLIHKTVMRPHELPFGDDYDGDSMNQMELSRRVRIILKTNTDVSRQGLSKELRDRPESYHLDKTLGMWLDSKKQVVRFEMQGEVETWFDRTWVWANDKGWVGPRDHKNIFWSMPTVSSVYAMYNMLISRNRSTDPAVHVAHVPLAANSYSGASTIEQEVNADISRYKKTIFLTVGKMLRGAKAPWSAVVRWDDYNDAKVGLQMELRGQNTVDPKFFVYDFNLWRAVSANYELIRSVSKNGGNDIDSLGQKLHHLIPMMLKGSFESDFASWDDIVKCWQQERISEGFKSVLLLDLRGLVKHGCLLNEVDTSIADDEKQDRDSMAGKNASKQTTTKSSSGKTGVPVEVDPLRDLKNRGVAISQQLPLLVYLTSAEFRDIDALFAGADSLTFDSWCDYLGLNGSRDDLRTRIPEIFLKEEVNQQLWFAVQRFNSGDFSPQDIDDFARSKDGDVPVSPQLVKEILDYFPQEIWKGVE